MPEQISWQLQEIEKHFRENGCVDFKIAQTPQEEENLWFSRRNASQSISVYGKKKLNEDVTVPRASLPALLEEVGRISVEYGFAIPCFGHTGDGNVHVNVMVANPSDRAQLEKGHQAMEAIFKVAIALEGTLSGEHGIGLSKAKFMPLAFNESEMALFRRIKQAFDPNNILNPFKMGLWF